MNEQIKKLGRQAMSDVMNGSDPYGDADKMYIPAEFMEKFAQLIVRECAKVMEIKGAETGHEQYYYGASLIEEHFGVEE